MKKLLKKRQYGAVTLSKDDDDFENFLLATRMRKCYYNETHNILGSTYGMCVLQVVHSSATTDWLLVNSVETQLCSVISILLNLYFLVVLHIFV